MGIGADKFPDDATQWSDIDGDGYGDNPLGNNPDLFITDATQWADRDGDGYGDNPQGRLYDLFPDNPTQWWDTDGDGYGDNNGEGDWQADNFTEDATQWADYDRDGYGDNSTGNNPDAKVNPIVTFPGEGTVLFGDKTVYSTTFPSSISTVST